jgi:hypothetical protein
VALQKDTRLGSAKGPCKNKHLGGEGLEPIPEIGLPSRFQVRQTLYFPFS